MNNKLIEIIRNLMQPTVRRRALKVLSICLTGAALVAGALCVTGFGQNHYQLGGAWVGGGTRYIWSCMFSPSDPAGTTAAARPILKNFGDEFAGLLAAFGADNLSDAVGEVRMISSDTARWTLIAHAQATPRALGDRLETKAILVSFGTWTYTSQDTAVLNYTINVYPAAADADGDGYPDANAQPVFAIPVVDNARRVPIL
jgi:hypothetical protein